MVVSSHPARLLQLYTASLTLPQLVFGVNFAESRLVKSALESFYGVGPQISQRLMARLSIHNTAKLQGLGHRTVNNLSAELQNLTIENNLRRKLQDNIKRLRDMGTYRGRRHAMSLPVRGQKTRTQVGLQYTSSASPKLTPCPGCNCQKVEQSSSQRLSLSPFILLYRYSHNCIGWRKWFAIPKILISLYSEDSHSPFYSMRKNVPKLLPTNKHHRVKLKSERICTDPCSCPGPA
jgi:small subunit ribosomal protein S13